METHRNETSESDPCLAGHHSQQTGLTPCCCFGVLYGIKTLIKNNWHSNVMHFLQNAPDLNAECKFDVRCNPGGYTLQTDNQQDVGLLNEYITDALWQLRDSSIRFEVHIALNDLDQSCDEKKPKVRKIVDNASIYVFGDRKDALHVGRELSERKLFLQRPDALQSDIEYFNPQSFRLPRSIATATSMVESTPTLMDLDKMRCSVDELFNEIDQTDLEQSIVSSSVQTELLPHQTKAVDFINAKESGSDGEHLSLWKPRSIERGQTMFQNTVTGAEREARPKEPMGGILADEMGLGKSLVVLSVIAGSHERASIFADFERPVAPTHSPKERSKATLILVPSTLILQSWIEQIKQHLKSQTLEYFVFHGKCMPRQSVEFAKSDIVFSTYATLQSHFSRAESVLHDIEWFRVVLDEAHTIRNQGTRQCKAVLELSAKHRWCLTGTPIQNRLEDLGSLVKFLRVPILDKTGPFRQHIIQPVQERQVEAVENLRLLLSSLCLRRTSSLLELQTPALVEHIIKFSTEEKRQYNIIGEESRRTLERAISSNTPVQACHVILQTIQKLRMACNTGSADSIEGPGDPEMKSSDLMRPRLNEGVSTSCSLCSDDMDMEISDQESNDDCGLSPAPICAVCQAEAEKSLASTLPISNSLVDPDNRPRDRKRRRLDRAESGVPSKLKKLLQELKQHSGESKSIVFSSWKKTLRVVVTLLDKENLRCVQVDSDVLPEIRRRALDDFCNSRSTNILLMTIGTGAVGINLTEADRVHILEPQWNPSMESQAIGRAFRLGQKKRVEVVRYITEHSIEQTIRSRQSKKRWLAQIGWESSQTNGEVNENLQDLRELLAEVN